LNYGKLREWAKAESIEISEMRNNTPQDEKSPTLEVMNTNVSIYEPKITTKKETTKQSSDRFLAMRSESFRAAADVKNALKEEEKQKQIILTQRS
jgi:hypothetical protein